ncbi:hypothetical protein CBR_g39506 [Chara braunii]|uniref:Uncharacterized protein n=1 Tax=Chara braunii TaxID=69332 RepID=A0A388LS63_CHABU|nr:hypothetical protein CBR_g39506 [Chara braunii]|eukprot:GBG85042.1 hypothetical protein CBR_g39506 [Chara braunii]
MAGPIQAALHIGVPEYAVGIGVREGRGGISRARAAGNDHGAVCHFLLPMSKVSPSVKFPASASSSSILASSSLASLIAPSSSSSSLLKVVFVSAGYGGHSEDGCCIWSNFGMGRGRWREEGRRSCRRTSYDHLLARRYGRESLRFPPLLTGLFSGRRAARGIRNMPRQRRPVAVSSDNTVPNLDDVEHLRDWLGDIQEYENPIKTNPVFHPVKDFFIGPKAVVAKQACLDFDSPTEVTYFRQAGPREKVDHVIDVRETRQLKVACRWPASTRGRPDAL